MNLEQVLTNKPLFGARLNMAHPLAHKLNGCWLLNETGGLRAMDLSPYRNHGTLVGFSSPPRRPFNGLPFDGAATYINCGNDNRIAYLPNGFSWVIFFKLASIAHTGNNLIIAVDNIVAARQWALWGQEGQAGRLRFYVSNSGATAYIGRQMSAASALVAGELACLGGTWDGTNTSAGIKIFKNAIQVDDTNFQNGAFVGRTDTGQSLEIGRGGTLYTSAKIYLVMLYAKKLVQKEIEALYADPYQPMGMPLFI